MARLVRVDVPLARRAGPSERFQPRTFQRALLLALLLLLLVSGFFGGPASVLAGAEGFLVIQVGEVVEEGLPGLWVAIARLPQLEWGGTPSRCRVRRPKDGQGRTPEAPAWCGERVCDLLGDKHLHLIDPRYLDQAEFHETAGRAALGPQHRTHCLRDAQFTVLCNTLQKARRQTGRKGADVAVVPVSTVHRGLAKHCIDRGMSPLR